MTFYCFVKKKQSILKLVVSTMRKPKQKLEQMLEIPDCLVQQLKAFQETSDDLSVVHFLLMSVEETDATKQTSNLKKAIDCLKKLLPNCDHCDMTDASFQVLCYVFIDCDAKNPCRRTIASFFQGLPDPTLKKVSGYLAKTLLEALDKVKFAIVTLPNEDKNIRKHVDTVCALLENFPMGEKCVSVSAVAILEFLVMSLECQVINKSLVGTPALQTAAMLDCLVTIKATMSVVQKCNEELAQELHNSQELIQLFHRFIKIIVGILRNDSFFPDCRSAAGMAFPLIVQISAVGETLVPLILSLFFPSYICQPVPVQNSISSHWIMTTVECQNFSRDLSGFSYLSICRGVMTMVAREILLMEQSFIHHPFGSKSKKGTLLLDILFPEITSLCSQLKDSSALVAFRTLACWTFETSQAVVSGSVDQHFKSRLVGGSEIIQTLLNFVWNYWDHPVEAMRYNIREIFDNVVKMHVAATSNDPICDAFLEKLSKNLCEMDCFVRGKYGPLCCLVNILGAQVMLKFHPKIPQDLMTIMCDQSIVPHAMEFAEKMFQCHLDQLSKEEDRYVDKWFKMWVIPGLKSLSSCEKSVRKHVTEYYIPKLLKCCPQSLHFIIQDLQESENSKKVSFGSDNISCLVTCLKTARHLGLLPRAEFYSEEETNDLWQDTISVTVLEQSLCHLDDEIRIDLLGLICDSVRTTEPLTRMDLKLLKKFFAANMNSQSPSFRQRSLGLTKKLFIRLRDGGRSLRKKLSGPKSNSELLTAQMNLYIDFMHWFAHLQFASLFPGASFPRRTTALQNLNLLYLIFPMNLENEDPYSIFNCSEVFNFSSVHILLDCLKDTYDVNKQMAFDLLAACDSSIHPFVDSKFTLEWTVAATQSAVSPKAVNVSTAAFMFKLLIRKSPHKIILSYTDQPCSSSETSDRLTRDSQKTAKEYESCDNISPTISKLTLTDIQVETSIRFQQAYRVLSQLVNILQAQIAVARKSLLQAAFEAPIHGVLYCIREILCDLELNDVGGSKLWQSLVMVILQGCYDVTNVVSPVVTNASPEGNLVDNNDLLDDEVDTVEHEDFAPKAQILLVCCWRAMKEVSLLLGELTRRAPVKEKDKDYGLLSFEQFNVIGELFTNILLTSKHRGAYELAHEGFVKLCHMLWRCKQRELQCLPEKFLKALLNDISSDSPTPRLCGTRRSAGLPFFFKAIITTEPNTTGKCCFKTVMRELLNTATKAVTASESNKDTTFPQVHAQNILRALYKETKLGEDVYPFVAEGVKVAVEGFLSDSWAVRNSSTLLFSALMNRIFGPQKFQEEKRRQGMTGREFFSRFPSLHSFLIKQLEISLSATESENNKAIPLHPSLYPVLLLLSRLHPSAMDGNDSTLNMAAFIPYVLKCSKSLVFKTRAMAARALVPLVFEEALPDMFKELLESLPETDEDGVCQNHVHGCLLQIKDLLHSISINTTLSVRTKETIAKQFIPLLLKYKWIATLLNPCDMTRSVFLCIIRKFVIDQTWITNEAHDSSNLSDLRLQSNLQIIIKEAIDEVLKKESTKPIIFPIGRTFVKEEVTRIALQPIYVKSCNGDLSSENVSCLLASLSTTDYEVTLVALEFLCKIFLNCQKVNSLGNHLDVIVKELLRLAVCSTMKSSCLSQLYKCLSLAPRFLRFPWNLEGHGLVTLSQGWQNLLFVIRNTDQRLTVVKVLGLFYLSSSHELRSSVDRNSFDTLEASTRVLAVTNSALSAIFPVISKFRTGENNISKLKNVGLYNSRGVGSLVSLVRRSEIKSSLLEFSSVLVKQLHEEVLSPQSSGQALEMLEQWISFVEECAGNEECEILRLTVAQVLGSGNVTCILTKLPHSHEYLPFRLWKLIVFLLVDDSVDVKNTMAASLVNILEGVDKGSLKYCSMHSSLAVQFIVRKPLELFWFQSPSLCLLWLLNLFGGTSSSSLETGTSTDTVTDNEHAYDDMACIDRLFEKGPTNTHYEDCILAEIVFNTFAQWVEESEDNARSFPQLSQLLSQLQTFVKNQVKKCDKNLPQNLLYSNIYRTMTALAMVNMLLQRASKSMKTDRESTETGQALIVYREVVLFLQEMRRKDGDHCFRHLKLQEITESAFGYEKPQVSTS